jgi:hypothetical protein
MIEVRCCCDGHLVGHMEGRFTEGKTYTFIITRATPDKYADGMLTISTERITMTAMFWGQTLGGEQIGTVALQSRDYPIEKLKQIRGFHPVEAKP